MFDPRTTREVADQVAAQPAYDAESLSTSTQPAAYNTDGIPYSRQESSSTAAEEFPEEQEKYETPPPISSEDSDDYNTAGFIPIQASDRDALTQLARTMSHRQSQSYSRAPSQQLSRQDTLAAIHEGDEEVDPSNKKFDLYKWLRLFMHNLDEENIKGARAGVVFKDLGVSGSGAALQLQQTVTGMLLEPFRMLSSVVSRKSDHKQILRNFNGFLKSGELLIVLGRPGSGCSTFLKTICGETHGLTVDQGSTIHYNGVSQKQMIKEFKGEVVYNQEVDKHFPHLTVGQTLEFAAAARTPSHRFKDISRKEYSKHIAQVIMAVFGLSHTYNTQVGDDFVRGVSGGERKRVSIAEMAVAGAPLAAWDNSTRGLDSASALKFVESLSVSAKLGGSAHAVAIYQASQAIYDLFDKAIVLYEGKCIYYGSASKAKGYFEEQGWVCPQRQTTGDFLTSLTNPSERKPRDGMDKRVPRTAEDFEKRWLESKEFKQLQQQIEEHEKEFPEGELEGQLRGLKSEMQSDHTRKKSPFTLSYPMQIKLNVKRSYQRIWNDISSTATTVFSQIALALILGSLFYGEDQNSTSSFGAKSATLFFAVLLNALIAISEINSLYAQRPIVEKHFSYAFYHPSTEAIAGIVSDIPIKFTLAVAFNVILYFLAGLRYEPSQFFIFFLINFIIMFVMAALFRTMAAATKTVSQAMTLAGILVLALVIYTGFVLPTPYMHPWFDWIHYINPIYYAFEILVANEFHGRNFNCAQFVPAGPGYAMTGNTFTCVTTGAVQGQTTVSGDAYIAASYEYYYSHVWRNFGILLAFLIGFLAIYFVATEINSSTTSAAEVLVFRRGHVPASVMESNDEENGSEKGGAHEGEGEVSAIPAQKDIFTWRDVVYDIPYKGGERRLLDHVSGYVKPGTLTALMGVSGAGKTTLLDVLAQRTSMGVITGDMLVNGTPLDSSFQRKTGYVQQQDLHLETSTVRESLRFSAMLRQPRSVSKQEKYEYVEEVIKMLAMEDFAEAVVGVPGQGLNVEQRKLLTIGVELAAKPKLLLFLDEPTSGLDSQSAWAICAFLRKLANAGQAVLCTIHQPSAILFQEFDRLLFLAKGGKTVYFGEIGKNSRTLLDYFESNGARKCDDEENPAEYMLEIVNNGSQGKGPDWHETWKGSEESKAVQKQIDELHNERKGQGESSDKEQNDANEHAEFAMPLSTQIAVVTKRVFQQYWRMPQYIFAKWMLGLISALFIGFSFFKSDNSTQGIQNIIFSAFMIVTIFSSLVQQIMPLFVTQRELYEVRERPSKAYSWKAFLFANFIVEVPYNIFLAILVYAGYYYPIAGIQGSLQQGQVILFCVQFFIYAGTFAHLCIAALPDAQTAAAVVTLLFSLSLSFNGVMQPPDQLPGFWIFMYRVSPFTYWVSGLASTTVAGRPIECSAVETSIFQPPAGQTCGAYLSTYLRTAPGTLQNPTATADCRYCQLSLASQYLAGDNIYYSQVWRNFGIFWAYVVFNVFAAAFLYWAFRVKRWSFSLAPVLEKVKKVWPEKPKPVADDKEGKDQLNTAQPY